MPSRWCMSRLVQSRTSWSSWSTAPAHLLALISAPMWNNNGSRFSLWHFSSADFMLHLSPKKHRLFVPISWANQFEGHILIKIWIPTHYVLSNLCIRFIWVHNVQDTQQTSAFAKAKIAVLGWCTANWTQQHDYSGKVCVYYGMIEYTTENPLY